MIIKRYIVDDMKEALIRAKYELGSDAIIISQRTIKIGKWYNPFKKKKLEVTLAVEEDTKTEDKAMEEPEIIEPKYSLKDLIDKNPMFINANDRIRNQLLGYCKLNLKESEYLTKEEIVDFINIIFKDNCFKNKLDLCRINTFIGPTGVGKTTTIAKIAAEEFLKNKKKVGLITMDTYRIGAVEQLKTYAGILGVPFEVVIKPEEMKEKIDKLSNCDILLIDTLVTSQNNKEKIEDIQSYFKDIKEDINTYLTVSMSTDKETLLSILKKYKKLKYDALILTKFDEISSFANFWNIIEINSYPVQYFCYGQDVPDDIKIATLDNLISYSEEIYKND